MCGLRLQQVVERQTKRPLKDRCFRRRANQMLRMKHFDVAEFARSPHFSITTTNLNSGEFSYELTQTWNY